MSYTDSDLCDALERVHFALSAGSEDRIEPDSQDSKSNLSWITLSKHISQGGHNLSQGQRQLLCMAQAALSKPKILIMDEPTTSVNVETDAAFQKSNRHCSEGSTLIVIAHRLSTLEDLDKIFVFEAAKVIEHAALENSCSAGAHFGSWYETVAERWLLRRRYVARHNVSNDGLLLLQWEIHTLCGF